MTEYIDELISNSQTAFLQGRYKEALKYGKKAVEVDKKNADAQQCLANAYMSSEEYDKAIKHYEIAMENDSNNGDRYFNLGYAYATNNQPVDALAAFAKADEKGCTPNVTGQLYKIMAMVCYDMHNYKDAILNFIKAEKIIGIDMDMLKRKALSYGLIDDFKGGLEVANQIKMLAPSQYIGYRVAFNLLLERDRLEDAAKELERAERFADLSAELFFDWMTFETAKYELDHNPEHLDKALTKMNDGLYLVKPTPENVVNTYVNAADLYARLEKADKVIECLNAARNPGQSYNSRFSVLDIPPKELEVIKRLSPKELEMKIEKMKRQYGVRRLEVMARQGVKDNVNQVANKDDIMTPIEDDEPKTNVYRLPDNVVVKFPPDLSDKINRLYITAYTLKHDTEHIRMYASKLAQSKNIHSKCIGKYSLLKAFKEENDPHVDEEYADFAKFLRNESIKDPSDLFLVSMRIQCYTDMGGYNEAEALCALLNEDVAKPLLEQINKARSGGNS